MLWKSAYCWTDSLPRVLKEVSDSTFGKISQNFPIKVIYKLLSFAIFTASLKASRFQGFLRLHVLDPFVARSESVCKCLKIKRHFFTTVEIIIRCIIHIFLKVNQAWRLSVLHWMTKSLNKAKQTEEKSDEFPWTRKFRMRRIWSFADIPQTSAIKTQLDSLFQSPLNS